MPHTITLTDEELEMVISALRLGGEFAWDDWYGGDRTVDEMDDKSYNLSFKLRQLKPRSRLVSSARTPSGPRS